MKISTRLIVSVMALTLLFGMATDAGAATRVKGHTRKNGSYVAPHYRSNRDNSKSNNYSSKGNTNPHTGKRGTKDPSKK